MTMLPPRSVVAVIAVAVCLGSLAAELAGRQAAAEGQLGPPPQFTPVEPPIPSEVEAQAGQLAVDRFSREAVVGFYNSTYLPALAVPNDWTGSVGACNAGTTSVAYADATMTMVNYFRAMTGLPAAVTSEAVKDAKSQAAALMMTANNSLNHFPPMNWTCYTADGAEAAGKSNLALGVAGAASIRLYIFDPGAANTAVGHRRWILYPRQVEMGTGSSNNANALWVIGTFGTRPGSPATVAWPPEGYVPYQLVFPRWSFSVNTASSVSFTGATVSMTRTSGPVTLTVLPNAVGFGDNTLVWEPQGLTLPGGSADESILVQVNNVTVGGVTTNFSYSVVVIDPALSPPPTFTDQVLVPGVTSVKTVHIQELRNAVTTLRSRRGLPAVAWTDSPLAPGVTQVKTAHITELRAALNGAYTASGQPPPTYARTLTPGVTVITATDINELRDGVLALWP